MPKSKQEAEAGLRKRYGVENVFDKIPEGIKTAFNEYGFDKKIKLEDAIAVRTAENYYAVLLPSKSGVFAIDFCVNSERQWEVQNDYVEIESEDQFRTNKLIRTLF